MKKLITRRDALKLSAVSLPLFSCSSVLDKQIIDTHTHFYDPTRPQGVPWPSKKSSLYRKVEPSEFEKLTKPLGVTGTVVVEASNWLEDNQYLLDIASENEVVLGVVGSLEVGSKDFKKHIKRFSSNAYFRGIRINKQALQNLDKKEVREDFKSLSNLGLCVDINGARMLEETLALAKLFPKLRIVLEHLSGVEAFESEQLFKQVARHPNVFAKVSHVLKMEKDVPILDLQHYKKGLDRLWDFFGPQKLMYGSNWPVSDKYNGTYEQVFSLIDQYTDTLSEGDKDSFLAGISKTFYQL